MRKKHILLCCHQPIASNHLNMQRENNKIESMGVSIYSEYQEDKKIPIVLNADNSIKFLGDGKQPASGYIGPPYIILGSRMVKLGKDEDFKHWSGHYIKKASEEGMTIAGTIVHLNLARFRPLSFF